ncbi:iron ABC transporter substrate-binding protein [Desulfonatronum thioautotrophicum]|uniref:iron ABC transporter substrate-binding protein n=1 Tax=Desulfonatronum thioautotrophicum TaxID=617001 RepID=UPI0005EBD5BD|nr:iron ABC transporter substrate-binding protein [Desulfonatronum thioautotrophicum]
MDIQKFRFSFLAALTIMFPFFATSLPAQEPRAIMDMLGRDVVIPNQIDRVICSGSGCLRLLVYLQGQDRIVGVDSAEKGGLPFAVDARPYAVANPGLGDFPLFGEFRGHDNPELIAALDPAPQVILKANAQRDGGADALQAKTGIPVVGLGYGNLTHGRENLNQTLRIMAQVIGKEERAEAVIAFFDALQADLEQRAALVAADDRPSTFIGGIAMRGGHGFASTEPAYAPFAFLNVRNVAGDLSTGETGGSHATVAKEQLLLWDPDVVFLDISTTRLQGGANGLEQLRTDPAYQALSAIQANRVYGVFPYNFYTTNYESVFANAYFIGSVLYPEQFADIDPMAKAEEIATFLNGGPAFERINKDFENMGFGRTTVQ